MRSRSIKQTLFHAVDALGINRLLRWRHRGSLKVLLYHNIASGASVFADAVPDHVFIDHLRYLKRTCNLVSITQSGAIVGMRPDRVNVALTFDDGFINNAELAVPILRAEGASATFFVIVDCLADGAPPGFVRARLGADDDARNWRTVTGADVLAMRGAGMTIGSHTVAHADLRHCDDAALLDTAIRSRRAIEALLGEPVACLALPWGHHNPGQPQKLEAVYDRIFLTRHGFTTPAQKVMPRNEVTTLAHLKLAVSGAIDIMGRNR